MMPQAGAPSRSRSTGAPGFDKTHGLRTLVRTPKRPRICRIPIAPTNGGRINGTSSSPLATDLPQKLNRTLSIASGTLMAAHTIVVQIAISALFTSP
jgi:hypothetical protein